MADTPLITNTDGKCYENEVAFSVANYIDQMNKKSQMKLEQRKKWGKTGSKRKWVAERNIHFIIMAIR